MTSFAAYLRTSTDDHQSPEDSAAWQLRLARQLIEPDGGEIVAIYHDIDQSRSIPWERRPEASRILLDMRKPDRGWDDLVVAEPQRAFAGNQFGLVFPVLCHYRVGLWVPEVGGRVDPDSEAHDLVMLLFGGLAKAERNRIRIRVRAAMAAHASAGRWLGGRPPYGYRLIDAGPHPNPDKAVAGMRLHRLEPDPATATVVVRIFTLYVAGVGFKAIAQQLTTEGVPSPSCHDRARNAHRSGHAWASSAVRAILTNPRYLGHQVYGRQRRHDFLLNPDQPALGHSTRLRWQPDDSWVHSEEQSHDPLIDRTTWDRAQVLMAGRGRINGGGSPRSSAGRYALKGMLWCSHCNRRMQGNTVRGHAMYRCRLSGGDYAAPPPDHPPSLAVREDRILPVLDEWVVAMFSPDRIASVAAMVVEADQGTMREDPRVTAARRTIAEGGRKLATHLAALEAGMDPALVTARTRQVQAEIKAAQSVLSNTPELPDPLTIEEVIEVLEQLRDVPALLEQADQELRAELYQSLGLRLGYRRDSGDEIVRVQANLGVDLERVGGGT